MDHSLIDKSIILLDLANPELEPEDIEMLSIGRRDSMLFELRKRMFGSRLINTAYCPKCNEQIEWENDIKDLNILDSDVGKLQNEYSTTIDNFNILFRLPNTSDFLNSQGRDVVHVDSHKIIRSCITKVKKGSDDYNISDLPDNILNAIEDQIEKEDSLADIRMLLTCPNCSNQWQASFDIVSYLWAEINSWAKNTLQEVAFLAGSFGWSEQEVLSMSPKRRQMYLEMLIS